MLSQRPIKKIAVVDFDGTLCRFAFPDVGPIEPNVEAALMTLHKAGYVIKIHSCRTATYWNDPDRSKHIDAIHRFMFENGLPYDEVITDPTMDKPIAAVYIDDRAIRYENNWLEIADMLKNRDEV